MENIDYLLEEVNIKVAQTYRLSLGQERAMSRGECFRSPNFFSQVDEVAINISLFFNQFSSRRPVSSKKKIAADHAVDRFNQAPAKSRPLEIVSSNSEHLGKGSMKIEYAPSFEHAEDNIMQSGSYSVGGEGGTSHVLASGFSAY